ncbi:MAG: Rrf2 family transcriptional regulator [Phycisphaeraceae bacterium]|nr:Rrf2 family transcriptional regulator [Phycisphaeraceae bacterium]MCB9847133.1 Rrf2 family transcriptional regulator [Phycisphaeraceae bacterium]
MLSQTVEYALRAMVCLAAYPDTRVSAGVLADQTAVPPDYLAKVLQLLSKADLIAGRRGVGGGYQIARDPGEIGVLEVIRAVGTLDRITSCPLGIESHGKPMLCPLHHLMDKAIGAMMDVLDNHSLADIVEWTDGGQPLCLDKKGKPAPVSLGLKR